MKNEARQIGSFSPSRGENNKYLEPPPSFSVVSAYGLKTDL